MRSSGPTAIVLVAAFVLLPLLYVASIGPAIWCLSRGYLAEGTIEIAYWPVSQIYERSKPVAYAFDLYIGLWARHEHVEVAPNGGS